MLKGKNIVITGCNRGIGLAILRTFARNGATILACMRNESEETEKEVQSIRDQFQVKIVPIRLDLRKPQTIDEASKKILQMKIPIDGIVNNAGITGANRLFAMTSMDEIRDVFEVNFFGPMYFTQKLLKNMIRNKRGSIVNISSAAALDGEPAQLEYVASKAAVIGATKKLASELGGFGIRVNAVAPGVTDTRMIENMSKELLEKSIQKTALHRVGGVDEVAETAVFLMADVSSYITGQVIRVDGGVF